MRRVCARIAEQEFWLVWVFGVPLLLYSNLPAWLLAAAFATIPLFWLARRIGLGYWSVTTPPDVALALLVFLGFSGAWLAADRAVGLNTFVKFAGGVALYYSIVNGMRHARLERGIWLVLGLGVSMTLLGLLGINFSYKFLPPLVYDWLPKLDLTILNPRGFTPNVVAGVAAPLTPLALAWALWHRGRTRVFLLAVAAWLALIVLVTQSRGALLGLFGGLVVLGLYSSPRRVGLAVGAALAAFVALAWWRGENVWHILLASDANGSAVERLELWQRAVLMLRDFPFTGIGLGMFERTALTFYPLFENPPGLPVPHAHNLWMQMGVEFGVGGLVAFVSFVVAVLLAGIEAMRRARVSNAGWLAAGLVAGFVVYLIHGMVDAVGTSTKVSVVIWFMVALLIVLERRSRSARDGVVEWNH